MPRPPRKLASVLRRGSRVLVHAARRFYYGFLSGDEFRLACDVRISSGVRLRATDGGIIILGKGVQLSRGVTILAQGGSVELCDNVSIGEWSTITAKQRVVLGADTLVAERVTVRDQDHRIHEVGEALLAKSGYEVSPVLIGSNVWLAAGAVVLKGVKIGDGAIVAANAVVVRSVAARSIVGGVPAREIGNRSATTDRRG